MVDGMVRDCDVIALQEVHGHEDEMLRIATCVEATHLAFASPGMPPTVGEVMILMR